MAQTGTTQVSLAERSGIVQPQISAFLTGRRSLRTETLEKLLEGLDLTIRPRAKRRRG